MFPQITGKMVPYLIYCLKHTSIHQCPPPQVQEQPLQASHWPHLAVHHAAPKSSIHRKKTKNQRNALRSSQIPSQQLSNFIRNLNILMVSIPWLRTHSLFVHILVPLVEFKNAKKYHKRHWYSISARLHACDLCNISMMSAFKLSCFLKITCLALALHVSATGTLLLIC